MRLAHCAFGGFVSCVRRRGNVATRGGEAVVRSMSWRIEIKQFATHAKVGTMMMEIMEMVMMRRRRRTRMMGMKLAQMGQIGRMLRRVILR